MVKLDDSMGFNRASNVGHYRTSSNAPGSRRDISDSSYYGKDGGDWLLRSAAAMRGDASLYSPVLGQQQSTLESAVIGDTQTETLSEKMRPDTSYEGPKVNAGNMLRDANKAVTDGAIVSRQANQGMQDTQETIGAFKDDWKEAKKEAIGALKEVAESKGIDPKAAADQLIPDTAPNKMSALAFIAGELTALGGGSFVTFAKEIIPQFTKSKSDTIEDVKSFLGEMRDRLASKGSSPTAQQGFFSTPFFGGAEEAGETDIAWENLSEDDMGEFLAADPEGEDQPELIALRQQEHDLNYVLGNHDYVRDHYADVVTADKMVAAADSGNGAMSRLMLDATVVDAALAPQFDHDSVGVSLAGDSVAGVTLLASDTRFDSAAVTTVLDMQRLDIPEVQQQLAAHAAAQFG